MTEAFIITLYAGSTTLAVTVVDTFAAIASEVARLKNVLTLPHEDRVEICRWERHPVPTNWLLREKFEWR